LCISKPLLVMLSLKPNKISRGKTFDSLNDTLIDLKSKKDQIKLLIESPNDYLKQYCIDLKTDVQLATEEAIQQINDFNAEIIQDIDNYEKKCIRSNINEKSLKKYNKIIQKLELFSANQNDYLKNTHDIDNDQVIRLNSTTNDLLHKTELDLIKLKDDIFGGNIYKFNRNILKLERSILGDVAILNADMGSLILPDSRWIDLFLLCEFELVQDWNLIYRGSRDGFEAKNFHSKCNDKLNTLVIIQSTNGNVFGGYTEKSWSGGPYFKTDTNAFIFSYINKKNDKIKMKCIQSDKAIYCRDDYGPIFGCDNIKIENQSNLTELNWCDLGNTYKHPDYDYESNESRSFLTDSYFFKVAEIEVFTKI
jgi:hypothetical protein